MLHIVAFTFFTSTGFATFAYAMSSLATCANTIRSRLPHHNDQCDGGAHLLGLRDEVVADELRRARVRLQHRARLLRILTQAAILNLEAGCVVVVLKQGHFKICCRCRAKVNSSGKCVLRHRRADRSSGGRCRCCSRSCSLQARLPSSCSLRASPEIVEPLNVASPSATVRPIPTRCHK